jgi:hypothetical protein
VSLDTPVDLTPKPPAQGTHCSRSDDMSIILEMPHLQPKEMREMKMVLRFYWTAFARTPNGQARFKGPPPEFLQALGFQAEEMAGRISKWERIEASQFAGRPRGIWHGAVYLRNKWWKEAFTDYGLDPPKPHTEVVTKQGGRVYIVKWTPELARPEPTPGAEEQQPGNTEEGPQLIWTRKPSPGVGLLERGPPSTTQPGGGATKRGGTRAAEPGAGEGPTTSQAPTALASR